MITLNTIVYEGNFREVLSEESWFNKFENILITKKLLTVNNLSSIDEFNELRLKFPSIDVVYVSDNKDKVIDKYNLGINEQTLGYYYTISYFVMLEHIKTKYVLNVASDCMSDLHISDDFFDDSIKEMIINPSVSTTMIAWTKNNYIMKNGKKIGEHEEVESSRILGIPENKSLLFNRTANFTDQFFFGSVDYLKNIDYIIDESYSDRFYNGPSYGGNSFEKRMVAHQIKNNQFNHIYKGNDYYIHDGKYY